MPSPHRAAIGLAAAFLFFSAPTQAASDAEAVRQDRHVARVTITRDDWGIAHVRGKSDADAVFGMIYAQAEDDFNRIETNYLVALGRLAEAEGEKALWQDLRQRLFIDPADLQTRYAASPAWLRALMQAWADGLNFYLRTHPAVKPRVLTRFEPWMALSFSEGSIGGDIERVALGPLEAFYGNAPPGPLAIDGADRMGRHPSFSIREPSGSNGFAIAPAKSASGHALLLINPHTSFFFRSELQMTSEEGLDAYGAATWGQFFIYQGFNAQAGWMHTSSGVDVVDEFSETIVRRGGGYAYRYGKALRPIRSAAVTLSYRTPDGGMARRSFTTYHTHRGPIIRAEGGRWISIALMNKPVEALSQSYLRTKARDFAAFRKVAELKANSSNNTIFADAKGNIAYLHPQFIPRRDARFDYTRPVDGSDPATDWKGLHRLDESPRLLNPSTGWLMNTNNWPYSAAAEASPRQADFPRYMDTFGENPRGQHATMVLRDRGGFTLPSLIAAAYDSYLPALARLVPTLIAAWDQQPADASAKAKLAGQIALLRGWDHRWSAHSEPTTLAVLWGERMRDRVTQDPWDEGVTVYDAIARAPAEVKLQALADISEQLVRDFGSWHVPWGEINRFQRLTGAIVQPFSDEGASVPVGFTSAVWGSLASFGARRYPGTRRYYGTSGNSFVAAVEFGPRVSARAVTAGGESGDPASRHFNDQAGRYATGDLRPVYFYPDQLEGHVERRYRPGE